MIIMSVDYGDVRTGIAICDKLQILASPVCVITEKDRERLVEKSIGKKAHEIGREAFSKLCYETTDKYEEEFKKGFGSKLSSNYGNEYSGICCDNNNF